MKNSILLAIDLAKTHLQVCKLLPDDTEHSNKQIGRAALTKLLSTHKPALVAMESCGGAHHWARLAKSFGHTVKLIHPKAVKGLLVGQKTDKNDAFAIAVAARMAHLRSCAILTPENQALQALQRVRKLQIDHHTALMNQIRGLLLEFGLPIALGNSKLIKLVPEILEDADNGLPDLFRRVLLAQHTMLEVHNKQIEYFDKQINRQVRLNPTCVKLSKLEGVGPMGALALSVRLSDGSELAKGRGASACIGLTPKQHSSGGKTRLGHISKYNGDRQLRSLFFQRAMSVVKNVSKKTATTEKGLWLQNLISRRGKRVAAIALANKTVRTALALIKNDTVYKPTILSA